MKSSTAYERITLLNEEIAQGIKNLSTKESPETIHSNIEQLRSKSFGDRAPEAEFALLLFRKYASITNAIKEGLDKGEDEVQHTTTMLDSVPTFLYEGNKEELAGKDSFRKNIFWYRSGVAVFAFISFTLLVTTHAINYLHLSPSRAIDQYNCKFCWWNGCVGNWTYGGFNMRPYRAVLVVSAIIYSYSILFCVYYLLPVDEDKNKFLPGMEYSMRQMGMEDSLFKQIKSSVGSFCKRNSKFFEVIADSVLFTMAVIVAVIGSKALDGNERFIFEQINSNRMETQFYTLDTFYTTLQFATPPCTDKNPSENIHAALAIFYIVLVLMLGTLNVSVRSYLSIDPAEAGVDAPPQTPFVALPNSSNNSSHSPSSSSSSNPNNSNNNSSFSSPSGKLVINTREQGGNNGSQRPTSASYVSMSSSPIAAHSSSDDQQEEITL